MVFVKPIIPFQCNFIYQVVNGVLTISKLGLRNLESYCSLSFDLRTLPLKGVYVKAHAPVTQV